MKLTIDDCTTISGWSRSNSLKIDLWVNQIKEYITNDLSGSLVIHFKENSLGEYVEKTFSFDVTDYDELLFNVFSVRLSAELSFLLKLSEFKYSVTIGAGEEMGIPLYQYMTDVNFDIRNLTTINKIRITALTNDEDFLVVSDILAIKPELPLDIFTSMRERLRLLIDQFMNIKIDTITCLAGDTQIKLINNDYLDRYQTIKITDGINSEIHQIDTTDEVFYTFTSLYDGNTILHDYTDADVFIYIPVEYGQQQKEAILSGISLFSSKHSEVLRGAKLDSIRDSYQIDNQTVNEMQDYSITDWTIVIDCESRNQELLYLMSHYVRYFINQEYLWINGKKFQIRFGGDTVVIDATEAFNQIPKIQYTMNIEIKENLYPKNRLNNTVNIANNIFIR